eukprot:9291890-Alexandrium_andersonii.AAC.1
MQPNGRCVRCSPCLAMSGAPVALRQCPGSVSARCVRGEYVRLFARGTRRAWHSPRSLAHFTPHVSGPS